MWYRGPRWRDRLEAEIALMRERFPNLVLARDGDDFLRWEGTLEPAAGRPFRVAVIYPERYPYAEPKLWVIRPPIRPGAPHVYADGSLCIHRRSWDPLHGTATSCVPLLSAWLVGYLHWIETGEAF